MSAQSPTGPPQPPKSEAYTLDKPNPVTRTLPEYAVADTPGTSGPEFTGPDYLECRSPPPPPPTQSASESQTQTQTQTQGCLGGTPMPAPLEHGVDEHARRATRHYAGDKEEGEGEGEAETTKQNENVDAEQKMATYAEGQVAHAVEGQARKRGSKNAGAGGEGLHGRGRGEVPLEPNEADLERKKAQQSVAREQIKEARSKGYDVDGRGTSGPSGRQPRAEID
ncbi:hypothetical protein VTK56DRAFT_7923 [Thermocarpiscus australiensis]